MPVIFGRTGAQLRQAIGYNLGAIYVSSASSAGTTTTIPDNTLIGGTDNYRGNYVIATSGTNAGSVTRVASFTGTTLTVSPAFGATVPSGMTYEMFTEPYSPALLRELSNQAILDVSGLVFDPEEDISLAGDGRQAVFAIPAEFTMLNRVSYRSYYESLLVEGVSAAWSELVNAGLSATIDTKHYKTGQSMKVVVTAAAAADARITAAISALDISGKDYIEFWIESSIATVAADIHLLLDDTAQAASALETLAVPALVAGVPKFVRIALAAPQNDTAIISVGLRFTVDNGAQTVWLNQIRAVRDNTAIWTPLNWSAWTVDEEARTLILRGSTAASIGHALLKLEGGDRPVLLTADATVCEIDDWYVICRATELALAHSHAATDGARQLKATNMAQWKARADAAKRAFPPLVGARMVG